MPSVTTRLKDAERKFSEILAKEASRASANSGLPSAPGRTHFEIVVNMAVLTYKRMRTKTDIKEQWDDFALLVTIVCKLIPMNRDSFNTEFDVQVRDEPAVKLKVQKLKTFVVRKCCSALRWALAQGLDPDEMIRRIQSSDRAGLMAAGFPSLVD